MKDRERESGQLKYKLELKFPHVSVLQGCFRLEGHHEMQFVLAQHTQ